MPESCSGYCCGWLLIQDLLVTSHYITVPTRPQLKLCAARLAQGIAGVERSMHCQWRVPKAHIKIHRVKCSA